MAASDEIKDAIVQYYDGTGITSKASDWKRTDKRTAPSGDEFRSFHNAKLGRTVYTLGYDEDCTIVERDQWVYGFHNAEDLGESDDSFVLVFEPLDRFLRQGFIYDQHQHHALTALFDLPGDKFDEVCENQFVVDKADFNELTIHIFLKKLGFKFSKELTDFLLNHNKPTTSATGPDLTAWEPAFLDPNYSGFLVPASSPALAPTTQGVRIKNKSPGQSSANHAANQQAMMAQIGQMAASLGATGGVTIGSTHIPAMNPIGKLTLPPSGIFGSPGMQAAMPLMAGQYPELVNLQPAVQAAFIAQRLMNLQGLVQENTNWMDKDDVEKILRRHANTSFTLEIERSEAIWMLYELADDGSGSPLDDFFALDNEDLLDTLDAWGILDYQDHDEHEVEIIDDRQPYAAPYDLPVPQPQPAPPPSHGGGRQAPMVGPASINARSGSFAPLPAAPAAVAPPPPPPGNASANINSDSGDKWAEFCREVWDTYELNKANLPLDVTWYDRYRPREAQITGLGYEFIRRDFTSVRVRMGYLDRDGKLIDNIDLPSAKLAELLKEWGGDWNVDDITQDISKRKGENPETGFSYTSEQLWEEVEPFLQGLGWKESK